MEERHMELVPLIEQYYDHIEQLQHTVEVLQ